MLKAAGGSLDFIVDTASGIHPFDPYLSLLKYEGIIAVVAAPPKMKFTPALLFMGRWKGQHIHKSMIFHVRDDHFENVDISNLLELLIHNP